MTTKIKTWRKNVKNTWRYYPFTHVYHNQDHIMHGSFLRYKGKGQSFFVILGHFLLFDPPNNPKNQDFEKKLKKPGDIIILHVCTTNDYHMMYHS